MRNKKASVLMISLWILSILVILAISLGHRAAISLKLARNQRDGLKAYLHAKSGIYKAIEVLKKDVNQDYDNFDEIWSTGKDAQDKLLLDNIKLKDDYEGVFSVRYLYNRDTDEYLCMLDEERKININEIDTIPKKEILLKLFESSGIDKPEELRDVVVNWIDTNSNPGEETFIKNQALKAPEELLLILEYYYKKNNEDKASAYKKAQEAYNKIKELITVYPENGKININTASEDVLKIISFGVLKASPDSSINAEADTQSLIQAFRLFRTENEYFINSEINTEAIRNRLKIGTILDDNRTKIIDKLVSAGILSAVSTNFRIVSTGTVSNINKEITAIYDRTEHSFVYWKEN